MTVNVGRVIHSTRLGCKTITVYRTTAGWDGGEFKPLETETIYVRGMFIVAQDKSLQQTQEGDRITGSINVLTTEPLYPTGAGKISDVVCESGARYKVLSIRPNWFYGFYRSNLARLDGDGVG